MTLLFPPCVRGRLPVLLLHSRCALWHVVLGLHLWYQPAGSAAMWPCPFFRSFLGVCAVRRVGLLLTAAAKASAEVIWGSRSSRQILRLRGDQPFSPAFSICFFLSLLVSLWRTLPRSTEAAACLVSSAVLSRKCIRQIVFPIVFLHCLSPMCVRLRP